MSIQTKRGAALTFLAMALAGLLSGCDGSPSGRCRTAKNPDAAPSAGMASVHSTPAVPGRLVMGHDEACVNGVVYILYRRGLAAKFVPDPASPIGARVVTCPD